MIIQSLKLGKKNVYITFLFDYKKVYSNNFLSYTGNIKIHEVNKNGYYIRILNVSNNCDEDLSVYSIQQMVSSMPVSTYFFPNNLKILAGHTVTVWARTDEVEHNPPHTFIFRQQDKWGTGLECITVLAKPNGQVSYLFCSSFTRNNTEISFRLCHGQPDAINLEMLVC